MKYLPNIIVSFFVLLMFSPFVYFGWQEGVWWVAWVIGVIVFVLIITNVVAFVE